MEIAFQFRVLSEASERKLRNLHISDTSIDVDVVIFGEDEDNSKDTADSDCDYNENVENTVDGDQENEIFDERYAVAVNMTYNFSELMWCTKHICCLDRNFLTFSGILGKSS